MVRPEKDINWDVVEQLMKFGSSGVEIAGNLRIQKDTFYKRFKRKYGHSYQDYHADAHEGGKASLRASLWSKALNNKSPGNAQLLLFMGRCILGLKEPDTSNYLSPNQSQLDQSHQIMFQQAEIERLKEQLKGQVSESTDKS